MDYVQHFVDVLSKTVYFKDPNLTIPVVTAYTLANSTLCTYAPILLITGKSGSGKSYLSNLIAYYRGNRAAIVASNSSLVGIRNTLFRLRFNGDTEQPALLVWSDIKESTIRRNEDQYYALLRNGTSRDEDNIVMGKPRGGIDTYRPFCHKVLSTIELFYLNSDWTELYRRCLFIKMHPIPDTNTGIMPADIDEFNWHDMGANYDAFWSEQRIREFQELKSMRSVFRKKADGLIPIPRLSLFLDLIITSLVAELFTTVDQAIAHWASYLQFMENEIKGYDVPPLQQALTNFITYYANSYIPGIYPADVPIPIPASLLVQETKRIAKSLMITISESEMRDMFYTMGLEQVIIGNTIAWLIPSHIR